MANARALVRNTILEHRATCKVFLIEGYQVRRRVAKQSQHILEYKRISDRYSPWEDSSHALTGGIQNNQPFFQEQGIRDKVAMKNFKLEPADRLPRPTPINKVDRIQI
jgi:hypothetical protein